MLLLSTEFLSVDLCPFSKPVFFRCNFLTNTFHFKVKCSVAVGTPDYISPEILQVNVVTFFIAAFVLHLQIYKKI